MDFQAEKIKAALSIKKALDKWGYPELLAKITISFNNRFRSRAGDATWHKAASTGSVRLSAPLWPHMSETERYDTVIHEAAHIVTMTNQGYSRYGKPHGSDWKRLMWQMGLDGERCHSIDVYKLGISKRLTRYLCECGCRTHEFGPTVAKRIALRPYKCQVCKGKLRKETLRKKGGV